MSTDDLDFTRPARNPVYDPAVARVFFESAGSHQSFGQGAPLFTQDQAGDTAYYLLEGEVNLTRGRKAIDILKAGEIVGEMSMVSRESRAATAVARTPVRAIALDARRFLEAVRENPEFALMLMGMMINRIRLAVATLSMSHALGAQDRWRECRIFDRDALDALARELGDRPPLHAPRNKVIMTEGEGGVLLYVVVEGVVAISVKGKVMEKAGPGGVLGEMALVSQAPRTATATAETDCSLFIINRTDFLELVKTRAEFALSILRGLADRLRFLTAQYG